MISQDRARDLRIIQRFGNGTLATLRQKNSIVGGVFVRGGVTAGASTLTANSGDGEVVQGAVFTVAGVSGSYAIAEAARAASGRLTLHFLPPLAESATDGAAMAFAQPGEWQYPAMDGSGTAEVDKEITAGRRVRVLAYQPGKPAPRDHDDELDGQPITGVHAVGNPPTRYRVTVTAP